MTFKILKITPDGQITTFAGSGQRGHADGTGSSAVFYATITLAIDPASNLYVGDVSSFRKITPSGVVSTLTNYFTAANSSWVVGVDSHFNLYESDAHMAIKIDTIACAGAAGAQDGNSAIATFNGPVGLALDNDGNIIIADYANNKVRKVSPQ